MEELLTICRLIYWSDFFLIILFHVIGYWAIKKEFKDNWGDKKTMEMNESERLSDEWENRHPILNFFQDFNYELRRIWQIPEDKYYDFKYFIQRGRNGYSIRDVWGFDYYLSKIIVNGLKDLKEMVHGVPSGMIGVQGISVDKDDPGIDLWKKELDKMIWTFEATQKIQEHDWIPVFDEKDRVELKKYERRLNRKRKPKTKYEKLLEGTEKKYHLMTKAEMKKYHEGWKLFKRYYFDLWD